MTDKEALQAACEKLLQATKAREIWWVEQEDGDGFCFQRGAWKACIDDQGNLTLSYLGRTMLWGEVPLDLYREAWKTLNPSPGKVFRAFAVCLGEPPWQGGIP